MADLASNYDGRAEYRDAAPRRQHSEREKEDFAHVLSVNYDVVLEREEEELPYSSLAWL